MRWKVAVVIGFACLAGSLTAQNPVDSFVITIDNITPVVMGKIPAVQDVQINLRYTNRSSMNFSISNSFTVYSPDGAVWDSTNGKWTGLTTGMFDLAASIFGKSRNGMVADSITFTGSKLSSTGMPAGFDQQAVAIVLKNVHIESIGTTICIDTGQGYVGSYWYWIGPGGVRKYPKWEGPYCFEVGPCCVGARGNADLDPMDMIDLGDLIAMVDHLFFLKLVKCRAEGDIDPVPDGLVNISDIQLLVDYLFFGYPLPATVCP